MSKRFTVFVLSSFLLTSTAVRAELVEPVAAPRPPAHAENQSLSYIVNAEQMSAKPGAVFTQGGDYSGITLPYPIGNPKPIRYPRWAVRQGWQGEFSVAIEVLLDGSVGRHKVMKSTGYKVLDETALKTIKTWKFQPAMKNGKPIVECVQIPVFFELSEI